MSSCYIKAKLHSDGTKYFYNLTSFQLVCTLDSPATSFKADVLTDSFPENIDTIELFYFGKNIFSGKLDQQKFSSSEKGMILSLEARDKAASLLDNEALPCTLWGANLSTIFLRYVGRFGYRLVNKMPSGTLPVFTVHKGTSYWDSFTRFCRNLHSINPYIVDDQVFCEQINAKSSELVFSNTDIGIEYTKFEHVFSPYEIISKIYLRDEQGQYSSSVKNSVADFYNVHRERYVLPASDLLEFSGEAADANTRIKNSMRNSESYIIEAPEFILANLADTVSVKEKNWQRSGLIVQKIEQQYSNGKFSSTIHLKKSIYL